MKSLENYGVQVLDAQEISETNGGFILTVPLVAYAWGYLYERYVFN